MPPPITPQKWMKMISLHGTHQSAAKFVLSDGFHRFWMRVKAQNRRFPEFTRSEYTKHSISSVYAKIDQRMIRILSLTFLSQWESFLKVVPLHKMTHKLQLLSEDFPHKAPQQTYITNMQIVLKELVMRHPNLDGQKWGLDGKSSTPLTTKWRLNFSSVDESNWIIWVFSTAAKKSHYLTWNESSGFGSCATYIEVQTKKRKQSLNQLVSIYTRIRCLAEFWIECEKVINEWYTYPNRNTNDMGHLLGWFRIRVCDQSQPIDTAARISIVWSQGIDVFQCHDPQMKRLWESIRFVRRAIWHPLTFFVDKYKLFQQNRMHHFGGKISMKQEHFRRSDIAGNAWLKNGACCKVLAIFLHKYCPERILRNRTHPVRSFCVLQVNEVVFVRRRQILAQDLWHVCRASKWDFLDVTSKWTLPMDLLLTFERVEAAGRQNSNVWGDLAIQTVAKCSNTLLKIV